MKEEDFKQRVKKLKEVNSIITKLDPAIREHAFKLLEAYITGKKTKHTDSPPPPDDESIDDDMEKFFSKLDHEKPSDNAFSIAANHYSQYGKEAISYEEIRVIADKVGITIPERVDMTFKAAQDKGKNLFQSGGRGKTKPTVHGEKYLKDTFGVKKGNKKKVEEGNN